MCPLIEELMSSQCDFGEDEPELGVCDFSRIRKLKYSGSSVPSLSFKTIPKESEITIMLNSRLLQTSWFLKLREFLLKLSPSKISLYLSMSISSNNVQGVVCLGTKPPVVVEKLTLLLINVPCSLHHALSDGLFGCCRPSFMNIYFLPSWCVKRVANNGFTELICKTLIEESGGRRNLSAMHDLEEVNVDFFAIEECLLLPCKTLLDASTYSGSIMVKVCLQLKWAATA
ncbi:hypothetical protein ACS0TY_028214 [Phlomoides rotata]